MRLAAREDLWRAIQRTPPSDLQIHRLTCTNVPGISPDPIDFSSPLTVLSGPNGAGKSTLLRALWACLDPAEAQKTSPTKEKLSGGSVNVSLSIDNNVIEVSLTTSGKEWTNNCELDLDIIYIDTSLLVPNLNEIYCEWDDIDEFLAASPSYDLNQDEIERLSLLCMRRYRRVRAYEIDMGDDVFPFFSVDIEGASYDARSMGWGELASFYFWWVLKRIDRRTLLIIEEPESYLSPNTTISLFDLFVEHIIKKKIVVITSSHSPGVIGSLPDESIRFFYRQRGVARLADPVTDPQLQQVGIKRRHEIFMLVEDEMSRRFALCWIEYFAPWLLGSIRLHAMGGVGEIRRALDRFPVDASPIHIRSLFDGDQRNADFGAISKFSSFLPTDQAPERLFRDTVEHDVSPFFVYFNENVLGQALAALDGLEDHDWWDGLWKALQTNPDSLTKIFFDIWISNDQNKRKAQEAFDELLQRLPGAAGRSVPPPG